MSENWYLYAKSLHIVFIVTWFAALFYVVRLFVYQSECNLGAEPSRSILCKQFKLMSYRLWYVIGWPSAVLAILFGLAILAPWWGHTWMYIKLGLVGLLLSYHLYCHRLFLKLQQNTYPLSGLQLRMLNEVATLLLISIVCLAVWKKTSGLGTGLVVLFLIGIAIFSATQLYKRYRKVREKKQSASQQTQTTPPKAAPSGRTDT